MAKKQTVPFRGKPNAAQRLLNLENRLGSIENTIQELVKNFNESMLKLQKQNDERMGVIADEIDKLYKTVSDTRKRVDATMEATDSKDEVAKKLVAIQVREMEEKINRLVELGALVESETGVVEDRSFVVGREIDKEGNEINPRLQFAVTQQSINEAIREKVMGSKVGEVVSFSDDGLDLEITKVYTIKEIEKKFDEEKSLEQEAQSDSETDVNLENPQD